MWEIAVHLAVACDVYDGVFLCCPFSHAGVLDKILYLIESVSDGFSSYSQVFLVLDGQKCLCSAFKVMQTIRGCAKCLEIRVPHRN